MVRLRYPSPGYSLEGILVLIVRVTLTIRISALEVEAGHLADRPEARPGSFVCLSVLDTGCGIPPENLTTQGYGEQYLKVPTQGPERLNRRVTVRRITPLLTGQN